jgi:hypothetical protein
MTCNADLLNTLGNDFSFEFFHTMQANSDSTTGGLANDDSEGGHAVDAGEGGPDSESSSAAGNGGCRRRGNESPASRGYSCDADRNGAADRRAAAAAAPRRGAAAAASRWPAVVTPPAAAASPTVYLVARL